MIKQANENDIQTIEEILLDAVMWMKKSKLQNQWNEDSIKWYSLSREYQINDFYIDYQNGMPAATKKSENNYDMALYIWHR